MMMLCREYASGTIATYHLYMAEKAVRKPTKKPVKKAPVKKTGVAKTVSKKTPTKKPATRKAPTRTQPNVEKQSNLVLYSCIGIFVCVLGASAFIGMSDSGSIDIQEVVDQRNEQVPEEEQYTISIPKDDVKKVLSGGLVPSGAPPKEVAPPPKEEGTDSVDDTATSTEDNASSTEEISTEESEEVVETEGIAEEETSEQEIAEEEVAEDIPSEETRDI